MSAYYSSLKKSILYYSSYCTTLLLSSTYLLGEQALICNIYISICHQSVVHKGQEAGRNIVNQHATLSFCFRMSGVRNNGGMLRTFAEPNFISWQYRDVSTESLRHNQRRQTCDWSHVRYQWALNLYSCSLVTREVVDLLLWDRRD